MDALLSPPPGLIINTFWVWFISIFGVFIAEPSWANHFLSCAIFVCVRFKVMVVAFFHLIRYLIF